MQRTEDVKTYIIAGTSASGARLTPYLQTLPKKWVVSLLRRKLLEVVKSLLYIKIKFIIFKHYFSLF